MITINNLALLDKEFLKRLDEYRDKKIMVKIISLNWDEEPIAEITGNITGGNINIDGSSAVRRTCNITLITNQMQIDSIHWSLRTKFTVEIGVKNDVYVGLSYVKRMKILSGFHKVYLLLLVFLLLLIIKDVPLTFRVKIKCVY